MSALDQLTAFYASQREATLPESALSVMRLCLLDWLIVSRAAKGDAVAENALAYARSQGQGDAALFFGGAASPRIAALANGTVSHALDYDDTHFAHIGHVSTVVVPAALAMGQARAASFETVLRAALMGAEAATRTGVWLGRDHYQIGFHQTATAGAIGAAVAASVAAGLPDARAALTNAAGFAAGLKAQFGTPMKPVNAGMAAANGVEAALMGEAGLFGSGGALDALCATHHGEADMRGFDGIGEAWLFEQVTHKFHPCCHGTHAAIEALMAGLQHRAGTPDKVLITTHPRWMSVCNKPAPSDHLEAKFSYKALAALLMQNGAQSFDDAALKNLFPFSDETQDLLERVEVVEDESVSEEATLVSLTWDDETKVFEHDLTAPLPYETRLQKLLTKGDAALGQGHAARYWSVIEAGDMPALVNEITT